MMAGGEETKLDDATIRTLESSLSQKAKELYEHLKSRASISLHDARKDRRKEQVRAYCRDCGDHYEIWLTPDDTDLSDSFLHEIGQVNVLIIGYKALKPRLSFDPQVIRLNNFVAAFARNAFISYVCERGLEKSGIDRSFYKRRAAEHFREVLTEKVPRKNHPDHMLLKKPYHLALLCYEYVSTRLLIGSDFEPLEQLFQEKIQYSNVKHKIRVVYSEALREEITPKRYEYLQLFFADTLELNIFGYN